MDKFVILHDDDTLSLSPSFFQKLLKYIYKFEAGKYTEGGGGTIGAEPFL